MRERVSNRTGSVVLTGVYFVCTACGRLLGGRAFGALRRTADGVTRNQPQCIACRGRSR